MLHTNKINNMKTTFEKQNFNEKVIKEADYVKMFAKIGFEAQKVDISFTNGCSAYITLNVKVLNEGKISIDIAKHALDRLKVDNLGLDDVDIRYLKGIIERFKGGPVGLEAIASSIQEEAMTLEDVYEPYLLQIGFINRTARGRVVTLKAYEHLGFDIPENLQKKLI